MVAADAHTVITLTCGGPLGAPFGCIVGLARSVDPMRLPRRTFSRFEKLEIMFLGFHQLRSLMGFRPGNSRRQKRHEALWQHAFATRNNGIAMRIVIFWRASLCVVFLFRFCTYWREEVDQIFVGVAK
jgi:hypothetical protein